MLNKVVLVLICFALICQSLTNSEEWLEAASKGNLSQLEIYFADNPSLLNFRNPKTGRTAILEASIKNHTDILTFLLRKGANIEIYESGGGLSVFDAAVKNGNLILVQELLELVNPNEETPKDGYRPIHRVVEGKTVEYVQILSALLLSNKVSPNDRSRDSFTPLEIILKSIRGTQYRQAEKHSASTISVKRAMVRLLIQFGAHEGDLNDDDIFTLGLSYKEVEEARKKPKVNFFSPSLRKDLNLTANDRLLEAIQRSDWDWAKLEIEKNGADVNIRQTRNEGQTILLTAVLRGDIDLAKNLIKLGADPNIKDNNGYSLIHGAAYQGHAKMAKYLIEELGLDPNESHKDGYLPIHRGAWGKHQRHTDFVRYILSTGKVDVDSKSAKGLTPLKILASHETYQNKETAKVLVHFGADVSHLTDDEIDTLEISSEDDFSTCPITAF